MQIIIERHTRLNYVVCGAIGACSPYVLVTHGNGRLEKVEGFRDIPEAEKWIARRLRNARLVAMETALFSKPWLISKGEHNVERT